MRISTLILILISGLNGYGQDTKDLENFKKELRIFRYSLHKELNKMESEDLLNLNLDNSDSIIIKIKSFTENNSKRITTYRIDALEKFTRYEINFDNCLPANAMMEDSPNAYVDTLLNAKMASEMIEFLFIDPVYHAEMLISLINYKYLTRAELGVKSSTKNLAQSLIRTKQITKNNWEILIDDYDMLFKLKYNPESGKMTVEEIFRRTE